MTRRSYKLDRLQITVPCSIDWDQMVGTDRIRYCSECSKDVYNISRMTVNEAEALISSDRESLCLRLVRNADGATLTEEPRAGLHLAGRRVSPIASALVTAIMSISGSAVAAPPAQANSPVSAYSDSVTTRARGQAEPGGSTSTLEGTVLDPNQAVIVGATVMLRNEVTGDVRVAASSESGAFSFPTLKPGPYTLEVRSEGFSPQRIGDVGVAANQVNNVAVTMKPGVQKVAVLGRVGPAPQPLRSLYNKSELIVVARVIGSKKVEQDGSALSMKTTLIVSSTLKGKIGRSAVHVYHWTYGEDAEQRFVIGNDLLLFLKRREDRTTHRVQDGYEVEFPGYGIKKLWPGDLAVYVSRIEELREMKQPDVDSPEIAEWLVRCAEEPVTRWEGASELAWSAASLEQDDDETETEEPAEKAGQVSSAAAVDEEKEEDAKASADEDESATLIIKMLTERQKERLAGALYGTAAVSERERELIEIEKDLKDPRLLPFLITQLHVFEPDPPEFVETIVNDVAELMEDEEVTRFLEECRENASSVYETDESVDEDDDATEDESVEDESAEAGADRVAAAAATANRRIMLQKFLMLVEKKVNHSASPKSGASGSSPDSMR